MEEKKQYVISVKELQEKFELEGEIDEIEQEYEKEDKGLKGIRITIQ